MNTCPICDKPKKEKHIICEACYKNFKNRAGFSLGIEEIIIPFPEWIRPLLETRLNNLQVEFAHLKKEKEALQSRIKGEAYEAIRGTLKGKRISTDVFRTAMQEKKSELWKKNGGNKIHWEIKQLENQIPIIEGVLSGFQKKDAEQSEETPTLTLIKAQNE